MNNEIQLIDGCKYSFYIDESPFIGIFKSVRNAFFDANDGNKICGKNQAKDIKLKSDPDTVNQFVTIKTTVGNKKPALTKDELEVLENAPESAVSLLTTSETWDLSAGKHHSSVVADVYVNEDGQQCKLLALTPCVKRGAWVVKYDIIDLRKRKAQEDKQAKIIDAVNKTQANGHIHIGRHLYYHEQGVGTFLNGKLIYTDSEFNQCVKEMSDTAGRLHLHQYGLCETELLSKENSDYSFYEPVVGSTDDGDYIRYPDGRLEITIATKKERNQQVFTKESAKLIDKPAPDMLCRVEFQSNHSGELEVHTVTFKFKTDKEVVCIGTDGLVLTIDVEEFVDFHPVLDDLQIAKLNQIEELLPMLNAIGGLSVLNREKLVALQDAGELSKIVLEK